MPINVPLAVVHYGTWNSSCLWILLISWFDIFVLQREKNIAKDWVMWLIFVFCKKNDTFKKRFMIFFSRENDPHYADSKQNYLFCPQQILMKYNNNNYYLPFRYTLFESWWSNCLENCYNTRFDIKTTYIFCF